MDLLTAGDDGDGLERCRLCGGLAAGPCAACGAPVCGDCVVLRGGADVWAVCRRCDQRGGRTMAAGWSGVLGWIALLLLGLAAVVWALPRIFGG